MTFRINTKGKYTDGLKDMSLTAPARLVLQRLLYGSGIMELDPKSPADLEALGGLYNLWANGYVKRDFCSLELTNAPRRLNVAPTCTGGLLETWGKIYSDYPLEKARKKRYDD